MLYSAVLEIDERVVLVKPDCSLYPPNADSTVVVEKAVDPQALRELLQPIRESGITSIAVALMHSYW